VNIASVSLSTNKIMKKGISGVYLFQSKSMPDRVYVGSSINCKHRWTTHLGFMLNNWHNARVMRHYLEYGEDDFIFKILEECEPGNLREREQVYMLTLRPYFNQTDVYGHALHNDWIKRSWEEIMKANPKLDKIRRKKHLAWFTRS
jgi:group I intron endonuclease